MRFSTSLDRLLRSNFFIKLRHWEYWPFGIIQAPLFLYFPWLALRARSIFFFSASNPGILMGGMFGESKFEVMQLLPAEKIPKTLLQKLPATSAQIIARMKEEGMNFPVIFKPDLGERGWMVRRIDNLTDIAGYLSDIRIDFVIQEFVDLPLEFGVFYVRYPSRPDGMVTSIVEKQMLSVTGDGKSTIKELIWLHDRAKIQWHILKLRYSGRLSEILPQGEKLELISIGNHCLGTRFINANGLITEKLSAAFDQISKKIEGFYFGRFDLRAASYHDLEAGIVKILELNGCGAEPAHIYDPGFSLWEAVSILIKHWSDIYRISIENHLRGTDYISFQLGKSIYQKFRSLKS
jgi:hypothetical protein